MASERLASRLTPWERVGNQAKRTAAQGRAKGPEFSSEFGVGPEGPVREPKEAPVSAATAIRRSRCRTLRARGR
jgi:hypothetical protein